MTENTATPLRHYLKRDAAQARAYSQAVVTAGGRTVWLVGQVRRRTLPVNHSPAISTVRCGRCSPAWVRLWPRSAVALPIW